MEVSLYVPPAETLVLGDPIPLIWRFRNTSEQPLAFMWEGCCRLNGRVRVTRQDELVTPIPPGSSLTHQFARAETVAAGAVREFPTLVSDWILLPGTGTYRIQGRYTGVLPEQRPQVAKTLELWRDSAEIEAITLNVVSVTDYWALRAKRTAARKLKIELEGPGSLPALNPAELRLRLVNTSDRVQVFEWPTMARLWVLDSRGVRIGNLSGLIEGAVEPLFIPGGGTATRTVPLDTSMIEGEPFGEYQIFVDLTSPDGRQPRAPSNVISAHWRIGAKQVKELLTAAARGAKLGSRNPALKLLRSYLNELREPLEDLADAVVDKGESELAKQLVLAARLKPMAPTPGRVELRVKIKADNTYELPEGPLAGSAGTKPPLEHLRDVVAVKRHLGWDPAVIFQPDDETPLDVIRVANDELITVAMDLVSPPSALVNTPGLQQPSAVSIVPSEFATELFIRIDKAGKALKWRVGGSAMAAVKPPEAGGLASVADAAEIVALMGKADIKAARPLIKAPRDMAWLDFSNAVQPFVRFCPQIDLLLE
jgi:hypothetical protein